MNIEGLDYNTQRSKLKLTEYGREVQKMVEYCMTLPTKEERLRCAKSIIETMKRMTVTGQNSVDRMQTLWDHLALMSDFKLDIDYPVQITTAEKIASKPKKVPYPGVKIEVGHYGKELQLMFEKLKSMQPGRERDVLAQMVANQMKRCLVLWGHGNGDNEKVISDMARYTDGVIQLDPHKTVFEKINVKQLQVAKKKKRK